MFWAMMFVDHLDPDWKISTIIIWTDIKCDADIDVTPRIKQTDSDAPLTSHLALLADQTFHFSNKYLNI